MFYSRIVALILILSGTLKADLYGPMSTCAGPYACVLPSYLGIQFPDGSQQTTAALSDGTLEIGTIDTGTPTANGAQITAGTLVMQSASATRPGLVNGATQIFAGAKTFNSTLAVNSATAATNAAFVYKNGHPKSTQTVAPTAAPNANAGTGATCTLSTATDDAGLINLTTTAISSASGAQCAITFNKAYNVAPICVFSAGNANAATLAVLSGVYVSASTTILTVTFGSTDATGHAYVFAFRCVETQ